MNYDVSHCKIMLETKAIAQFNFINLNIKNNSP